MSEHAGAAFPLDALPAAEALVADRGYDSDGYPSRRWPATPIAMAAFLDLRDPR